MQCVQNLFQLVQKLPAPNARLCLPHFYFGLNFYQIRFFYCEFISEYFPGCVNRIFNYYFLCFFYLERKNRVGGCVNGPPSCFFCFVLHVGSYTFELLLINSALTSNYIQQLLYTFRNYRMIYDTALQCLNLVMFFGINEM